MSPVAVTNFMYSFYRHCLMCPETENKIALNLNEESEH